ncbi:DUF2357 domain-containing protein [Mycoplasmatota bacterium]|nr:DUF2357 domain-containing protein [Mycoplasmatota bacterium]
MKKLTDMRKFHQAINDAYYQIEMEEPFPNYFYTALLDGENELYQKSITEIKSFHEDWIGTIESFFPSIYKITRDPKSGLRYEQEVTAIEKAKRVNSDSVRHLAANTHLIKEFRNGNVIPSKILVTNSEIEYGIYENRFLKTLIDRLSDFIDRRYQLIKKNIESFEKRHFHMKSKYQIQDSKVEYELNVIVTEDVQDESINKKNNALVKRIEYLLKQINNIRSTQFMEELKNVKPVRAPIMQTSIILKNLDYKNCYTLWLYLDKYHTLDFDTDITEKNLSFDHVYMKNIYQNALQTFTNIYGNQKDLEEHYQYLDERTYHKKSPKVIKKQLETLITQGTKVDMEENEINQYYLEENKKMFKEAIDKHVETSSSYEVGLKKALRDTINISNALYKSYFDLEDDSQSDDFMFRSLVKESTEDLIEKTKDKLKVARIIRETKEVDYNNTIRLEKRLMKEIETLDKQLIKENKKRIREEAKRAKMEEKIKLERKHLDENQEALKSYLSYVNEIRDTMSSEHKNVTKKISETRKKIKAEEAKIIAAEKKKAKKLYEEQIKKIRAKQKRDKERLAKQAQKKLKEEKERLAKQEAKIKAQSDARLEKQKQKIQESHRKKIDKANQK